MKTQNHKKMKKLILMLFILSLKGYSQTDTTTYKFMDIMGITKTWKMDHASGSQEMNIFIDFGDGVSFTPDSPYKDESGKPIPFFNIVDPLNYFSKNGWQFVSTWPVEVSPGNTFERHVTHCLMKKPKYRADSK